MCICVCPSIYNMKQIEGFLKPDARVLSTLLLSKSVLFSTSQFSVSLAVPGLILAVVGKYIPTTVLLYVIGTLISFISVC